MIQISNDSNCCDCRPSLEELSRDPKFKSLYPGIHRLLHSSGAPTTAASGVATASYEPTPISSTPAATPGITPGRTPRSVTTPRRQRLISFASSETGAGCYDPEIDQPGSAVGQPAPSAYDQSVNNAGVDAFTEATYAAESSRHTMIEILSSMSFQCNISFVSNCNSAKVSLVFKI